MRRESIRLHWWNRNILLKKIPARSVRSIGAHRSIDQNQSSGKLRIDEENSKGFSSLYIDQTSAEWYWYLQHEKPSRDESLWQCVFSLYASIFLCVLRVRCLFTLSLFSIWGENAIIFTWLKWRNVRYLWQMVLRNVKASLPLIC